jgi:microcystin-dependent protein
MSIGPYIGEIQLFATPSMKMVNWLPCDGTLYKITDQPELFSFIGNTYGGDGQTTFAVPDLRDRVAIHRGAGPGLTPRTVTEIGGTPTVKLKPANVPIHNHNWQANSQPPLTSGGNNLAAALTYAPSAGAPLVQLNAFALSSAGGSQPHNNEQPTLTVLFAICCFGLAPV